MMEDFLSSSYVKPLDGFDANIITLTYFISYCIFLVVTEFGWKSVQTQRIMGTKIRKDSWLWLYFF